MTSLALRFNRSGFARFINSPAGRVFRLTAGTAFLLVGILNRGHAWGVAAMVWSFFPLTAGGFDWCYFSVALGGPLRGCKIREQVDQSTTSAARTA